MIFTTALALFGLPTIVLGQYGGGGSSSTSSAASSIPSAPADSSGHVNVDVAFNKTLTFHPANITATNGTVVTFFFPNNGIPHSVSQSSFSNPCSYLAASGSNPGGFDSGLTQGAQFSITITNDAQPIWYYCKTPTHCGQGMVGSINAPSSGNTFDAFQAAAKKIGSSETPEKDNGPVTGGVGAAATASPANTASASSSSSTSSSSGKHAVVSRFLGLFAIVTAFVLA